MLRFAVNISTVFTELPFLARPAAAAKAGFRAIETQLPYEAPAEDLARAIKNAGISDFVLMSFPAGDPKVDRAGIGALPHRAQEFRQGIERAKRYADTLGAKCLNLLCGTPGPEVDKARARDTLLENFRHGARAMRDLGATVLLEPINNLDVPGYFIPDVEEAIRFLDEVGEPNVGLQFDFYHVHRMGRPPVATYERLLPRIAHMQFSDAPGRREPGSGTLPFTDIFAAIERSAYRGWTSAEYFPNRPSHETLAWFQPYRR